MAPVGPQPHHDATPPPPSLRPSASHTPDGHVEFSALDVIARQTPIMSAQTGTVVPAPPPLQPNPDAEWTHRATPTISSAIAAAPQKAPTRRQRRMERRIKVLAGVLVLAAIVVGVFFFLRDTTGVSSLDTGDCFDFPETNGDRVISQPCDAPHVAQVYGVVTGLPSAAEESCFQEFLGLSDRAVDALPADIVWTVSSGTTSQRCIAQSPSGQLTGSLLG